MQSMTDLTIESIATSPPSSSFTLKDGLPSVLAVSSSPTKSAGRWSFGA